MKNIFKAYDKLMRHLHTLNVHHVHAHNVHYASHRSKTNLYDKSSHYNRIIANYGSNPNRFWSHLVRELARWHIAQSKETTDVYPRGFTALGVSSPTFIAYIIYKYIFDIFI